MILHVGLDRTGRRRLAEIAVLQRGAGGQVRVVPAWHADRGLIEDAAALRALLRDRVPR